MEWSMHRILHKILLLRYNIGELRGFLCEEGERENRSGKNRTAARRCGANRPEIEVGSRDSVAPWFHFISLSCGPHKVTVRV